MATIKGMLDPEQKKGVEFELTKDYLGFRTETQKDTQMRVNGVAGSRGATSLQFAGYTTLEQYYRGDQWDHNEPPGAAQSTDNYCAVIVDNLSSLLFDDSPEFNIPTDDPTDDILELEAEMKERMLWQVWKENNHEVLFDELSKVGSVYGDTFIKGPWITLENGVKRIKLTHIDNPSSIELIFSDNEYHELLGYIHHNQLSLFKAQKKWGALAQKKGITLQASSVKSSFQGLGTISRVPRVTISEYWTKDTVGYFVEDKLLDFDVHNYGFITLEFIKNNYTPNYPFGKSDIEDILDPQNMHNRTNADLANLLKWVTSINLWGKNLEGMQALVAGLSRIYSLPDDGEIHSFEKTGDPYIGDTYVKGRRSAVIELSGVSEATLSSSQLSVTSGRALAVAFQGTIRKLGPKGKRYRTALQNTNKKILKLIEMTWPKTKQIIRGDYRNEVHLPTTLLRNIVDTINKLQSGIISQETAMREAGVQQPKLEKKLMKKDLLDPVLGPQVARQPALLPRLDEADNQPGDQPNPAPGNQASASQGGAVANNNNSASGAAPTPKE